MAVVYLFLLLILQQAVGLVPPRYQWKVLDFNWQDDETKEKAIKIGDYIPENNMPVGVARWRDKLFITIPRLKYGVPSSLNYVTINGTQQEPLNPYPNWDESFLSDKTCCLYSNRTVVSTFRVYVDGSDRLWVVDNGVADMTDSAKRITPPALLVFDLKTDQLILRNEFSKEVVQDSSVLTSVVADITSKGCSCDNSYAYIADMGSDALIVYSLKNNEAWRIQNSIFNLDDSVIGNDGGILSVSLGPVKEDGFRDLYFQSPSCTKQYRISTEFLTDKKVSKEALSKGVEIVGDRGPMAQSTACDFDLQNNVLFYTEVSNNGIGCWNVDKPFSQENAPLILSDCNILDFPTDLKVDHDGNLWILSNRESRFLNETMDFSQMNFKVLTAPVSQMIMGTNCEGVVKKKGAFGFMKRPKSARSSSSSKSNSAKNQKKSK